MLCCLYCAILETAAVLQPLHCQVLLYICCVISVFSVFCVAVAIFYVAVAVATTAAAAAAVGPC